MRGPKPTANWPSIVAVILSGFCLTSTQLAGGRLLAPLIGTSIFVWTAMIGATLIGVTAGNYWAKRLMRPESVKLSIGQLLALGGGAIIGSLGVLTISSGVLTNGALPLSMSSFLLALIIGSAPAFVLSAILPLSVQRSVSDLSSDGTKYGSLEAWSAFGNILGVFLSGFVLISFLGTRVYLLLMAVALILFGQWLHAPRRLSSLSSWIWIPIALLVLALLPTQCQRETNYYCIQLIQNKQPGDPMTLQLDHLVHSFVYPNDPGHLGYGYEQIYANLVAAKYSATSTFSSFFIGGGGYVMPRYVNAYYPNADVLVSEIDPAVTKFNLDRMNLSATSTHLHTINGDARMTLPSLNRSFDLIFGDAFNDFSVPTHLTTVEFDEAVKAHLNPGGVYALNIIDDAAHGQFLAAKLRTLKQLWSHVYLAPMNDALMVGRNTFVLLASDQPLDRTAWSNAKLPANTDIFGTDVPREKVTYLLSDEELNAFLRGHNAPILTDESAPVDRYLAPVFQEGY